MGDGISTAADAHPPVAACWLRPIGAVEVLPADASTTMYEVWRDARNDGIGGSDIAAILGLVTYSTEYGVWLTKMGHRPPVAETPIMTRGRYAELMLGQWFADETGISLRKTGTWVVDGAEHLRCNPDRLTSDGGVAEMKAPDTDDWADNWKYGPAVHAVVQLKWCMAILGAPHGYVIADGGRQGLRWWRIERDDAELDEMVKLVDDWWADCIEQGNEPDVDRYEATTEAIKEASLPPGQLAEFAEVPGCSDWARRRRELKDQIKAATEELDLIENRIKAALRGALTLTDGGRKVITWAWAALNSKKPYRVLKEPKL
jgi:predicted phage-related endonuclease